MRIVIPISLLFSLGGTVANAALIDNGATTIDTVSGLTWLDLTETQGLVPSDILTNVGGFLSAGWQVATGDQVNALFEQFGVPFPGFDAHLFADTTVTDQMIGLLGQTSVPATDGAFGQGWSTNGGDIFSAPFYFSDPVGPSYTIGSSNIYSVERRETIGVFLVQDSGSIVSSPTTVALMFSALFLLYQTRYRYSFVSL